MTVTIEPYFLRFMENDPHKNETFIPYSASDVVRLCLDDGGLNDSQREPFESLATILSSIFHFEFHSELKSLRELVEKQGLDSGTNRQS